MVANSIKCRRGLFLSSWPGGSPTKCNPIWGLTSCHLGHIPWVRNKLQLPRGEGYTKMGLPPGVTRAIPPHGWRTRSSFHITAAKCSLAVFSQTWGGRAFLKVSSKPTFHFTGEIRGKNRFKVVGFSIKLDLFNLKRTSFFSMNCPQPPL